MRGSATHSIGFLGEPFDVTGPFYSTPAGVSELTAGFSITVDLSYSICTFILDICPETHSSDDRLSVLLLDGGDKLAEADVQPDKALDSCIPSCAAVTCRQGPPFKAATDAESSKSRFNVEHAAINLQRKVKTIRRMYTRAAQVSDFEH
jgi:hypothetical protein